MFEAPKYLPYSKASKYDKEAILKKLNQELGSSLPIIIPDQCQAKSKMTNSIHLFPAK